MHTGRTRFEPDTGMPIIAPADSTAEAPTEPATVPQQEQEPESVIEEQPVAAAARNRR